MNPTINDKKAGQVLNKYEKYFTNSISILKYSRKGLKSQAVFDFILISQFSTPILEEMLNKTLKTFTTYKQNNTTLDPVVSEKLLKLFGLYDVGISVFGSINDFNKWLNEPAFGLDNQIPRDLLNTITGIDLTKEELTRIEYGDLA